MPRARNRELRRARLALARALRALDAETDDVGRATRTAVVVDSARELLALTLTSSEEAELDVAAVRQNATSAATP